MTEKIKTQDALAYTAKKERDAGRIIGFTNGCFDILHLGHVKYLEKAKKECDLLVVGVNSDASVKKLNKGEGRPVNDEKARMEVLAALECVGCLSIFEEDTPVELIKSITPDILFKGGDWKEEDVVGADHVKSHGGKVRIIPYVAGYSTTNLIKKLRDVL